jgi:hypothetical protein
MLFKAVFCSFQLQRYIKSFETAMLFLLFFNAFFVLYQILSK